MEGAGGMTAPMPPDAPTLMWQLSREKALEDLARHNESANSAGLPECPCSDCRLTRAGCA